MDRCVMKNRALAGRLRAGLRRARLDVQRSGDERNVAEELKINMEEEIADAHRATRSSARLVRQAQRGVADVQ
jgi:hypothetical protein